MKRLAVAIVALIITSICVFAQSDTTVYFANIYAGPKIYELDGHSAIIVVTPDRPPVAYNYGVFDFSSPNFVYRFVKGETDYKAVEEWAAPFLNAYEAGGRRIVLHELNLDSAQKAELLRLLSENVRPENATYRYNYVKDNCATRPLDIVEKAAGQKIELAPSVFEAESAWPVTYRSIMRHNHRNYPWYQFGIDIALGSGIDYPLSRREMAFAPVVLDGMMKESTIGGQPLVLESLDNGEQPGAAVDSPTPWYLSPLAVCWTFFTITLIITVRDLRRRKVTRWFDAAYFAVLGLTGCLLTFLIFVSVHEATSPNWLYVWLNPLCLLPVILIWIKKAQKFLVWYQMTNFAVLFVMCAAWPWIPQSANAAFAPLVLAEMMRSFSYVFITKCYK